MFAVYPWIPLKNWDHVFVSLVGNEDMPPFSLCDALYRQMPYDSRSLIQGFQPNICNLAS
jgi:hypothetical protein